MCIRRIPSRHTVCHLCFDTLPSFIRNSICMLAADLACNRLHRRAGGKARKHILQEIEEWRKKKCST
jgi:hypothetical protein